MIRVALASLSADIEGVFEALDSIREDTVVHFVATRLRTASLLS